MTLLREPGLVGTGKMALAAELDLALGWMQIYLHDKGNYRKFLEYAQCNFSEDLTSLGDVLNGLFKQSQDEEDLRKKILELQRAVCHASPRSATMTTVAFETLSGVMQEHR